MRKLKIVIIIIGVCVLAVIVGKLSLDLFNKIDDSNNETETTTEYEEETTEQEIYYDCTINPINYELLIGTDAPNIKTKVNIEFRTPTADVLHSEYFILDEDEYELSENLYIAHIKVDKDRVKYCDSDKIYAIVTITDFVDDKSLYKENLEIKLIVDKPTEETTAELTEPATEPPTPNLTLGQKNALGEAIKYLRYSNFSRERLIGQLEYEGYLYDECIFAVDNCGADWNYQAVATARSYLGLASGFSYSELYDQLLYEKFTPEQAQYGVDNCDANWYEEAVKCAKSYLRSMTFSKERLISQLEYEGFTYEQAVYGVEQNGY